MVHGILGASIGQIHLTAAVKELARDKLDLVGVQKVKGDERGKVRARDYFSLEKELKIINWENNF